MNKKKLLSKLVVASVMVGGINLFSPMPNFETSIFPVSIARAEIKNITASDTAILDFGEEGDYIVNTAKNVAKERAIQAAKERAGVYLRSYSKMANGKLTADDISAVTNDILQVLDVKYRKLLYQAADAKGNRFGKVGNMYEATVTVKIDTNGINDYLKRSTQDKAKLIQQDKNAKATFNDINKNFEDLRKNAAKKSPQQINAELKKIDDKISAAEKRRNENKTATTENKPLENKTVINQPMKFSNPVEIGELSLPPMGFFDIKKSDYHNGTPCTVKDYSHLGLYAKGIARFGNGEDALYFHYDANNGHYNGMVSRFGSQDLKNTVEDFPGIPTIIWKIKTNVGKTFYLIEHGSAAGFGSQITLIGKNEKGTFVKYFNTYKIKDTYLGEKNHRGIGDEWNKISFKDNIIIVRYGKYERYNKFNAIGEFHFKWDESAQWFGVEHIKY